MNRPSFTFANRSCRIPRLSGETASSTRRHGNKSLRVQGRSSSRDDPQSDELDGRQSAGMESPPRVGTWWLLPSAVFVLDFTTFDVFSKQSYHLFAPVDTGVHVWVQTHVPSALQGFIFDTLVSDLGFGLPLLCWLVLDLKKGGVMESISSRNVKLGGAALLAEAFGGVLKRAFQRQRPRLDIQSFSFPSGHTLAAVMISGFFLFFKLYPAVEKVDTKISVAKNEGFLVMLWLALSMITVIGRIGADAHWVTDTLAGASLGVSVVVVLLLVQYNLD